MMKPCEREVHVRCSYEKERWLEKWFLCGRALESSGGGELTQVGRNPFLVALLGYPDELINTLFLHDPERCDHVTISYVPVPCDMVFCWSTFYPASIVPNILPSTIVGLRTSHRGSSDIGISYKQTICLLYVLTRQTSERRVLSQFPAYITPLQRMLCSGKGSK